MRRGRRFVWQVLLLPVLYLLSVPDSVLFANAISVLLLVAWVLSGVIAAVLVWAAREAQSVGALEEAADDAVTRFLIATGTALVAIVSLATNLLGITLPGRPFVAVLAWVLLLNGVPAIGWAARWREYWVPLVRERWASWRGRAPAE